MRWADESDAGTRIGVDTGLGRALQVQHDGVLARLVLKQVAVVTGVLLAHAPHRPLDRSIEAALFSSTSSAVGVEQARGVWTGSLDGAALRRLVDAELPRVAAPGTLLFVRQGTLFAQALAPDRQSLGS